MFPREIYEDQDLENMGMMCKSQSRTSIRRFHDYFTKNTEWLEGRLVTQKFSTRGHPNLCGASISGAGFLTLLTGRYSTRCLLAQQLS